MLESILDHIFKLHKRRTGEDLSSYYRNMHTNVIIICMSNGKKYTISMVNLFNMIKNGVSPAFKLEELREGIKRNLPAWF